MAEIKFTHNWNNKLACTFFTTIRLRNDPKYRMGHTYEIFLSGKRLFNAAIVDIRHFKLDKLNDFIAGLDTGYNAQECEKIIRRMYPKVDFLRNELSLILLQKDTIK